MGSVLPRALLGQINHANIRQSWEECQQCSPLTPCVKALQWSSDPLILLTPTSRQPCSNGDFMDGVPLYRDCGRLWEPDVLYGQSQPITCDGKSFRCFSQVQALICQLNLFQDKGEY